MDSLTPHEQFLQDTIACQGILYAFILSLTADTSGADEILQETNLAILRKENEFTPGTDFKAWVCTQAFYNVLTSRKRKQRSQLVFDDRLVQLLANESRQHAQQQDARRQALRYCISRLDPQQRDLLEQRYGGVSVTQVAETMGRTVGYVSQTLYRLRKKLKDCINRRLAEAAPQ